MITPINFVYVCMHSCIRACYILMWNYLKGRKQLNIRDVTLVAGCQFARSEFKPFIVQLLPFDSTKKKKKKKVVIQDHGDNVVNNLADKAQNLSSMSNSFENVNSL